MLFHFKLFKEQKSRKLEISTVNIYLTMGLNRLIVHDLALKPSLEAISSPFSRPVGSQALSNRNKVDLLVFLN